jgi:hypothetical protein
MSETAEHPAEIDWTSLPEGVGPTSLWVTLHDSYLTSLSSNSQGDIRCEFDHSYLWEILKLPSESRFVVTLSGIFSARAIRSLPFSSPENKAGSDPFTGLWRNESVSWRQFEKEQNADHHYLILDPMLAQGANQVCLNLGGMEYHESDSYTQVFIRACAIHFSCTTVGDLSLEQFIELGENFWKNS